MGDYVWVDKNRDGIQDKDEDPLEGVVLKLIGPDGKEVVDINGNPVGPVSTDENGYYIFKDLPVLKDGESYTVVIDREESADVLDGYLPTKENGTDREKDSSTWEAKSEGLNEDGDHDGTLDFGFYLEDELEPSPTEPTEPSPTEPTEPSPTEPTEPSPSESTPTDPAEEPSEDPTDSPEKSEDPSQDPTPTEMSEQPSASESVDGSEEPQQTQEPRNDDNLADTGIKTMSLLVLGLLLAAAGVVLARRTRGRHS
ncbi:hypothetical protein CQ010_17755 [Arthrobacter sp. MYb211]|uniref:SdrD B-like domain-containing protein n=1 Tax=unclassified Arthrobacter TaxID=235627 RepID=UPI000CFC907A|nr:MULTISPECIES: SdrD B-like domain-containing protein [unclassified Arthrobacter]PRA08278.1 hypothetical protein CQ015_17735 [Arthrobacter sp. MYb221]PRC02961.1 hypothetical protein CQ010_17755 [Arthrobacter sp. MYb211]